jgi:hypothetical protein
MPPEKMSRKGPAIRTNRTAGRFVIYALLFVSMFGELIAIQAAIIPFATPSSVVPFRQIKNLPDFREVYD